MAVEIERKFLVVGDAWRSAARKSTQMRQAYLGAGGGRASIRVRLDSVEARLNIKAAVTGASRAEYDYAIPVADAEEIYRSLCVGQVEKTRHLVEHAGHTWEIDEFEAENAGLIVAEIELDSVDEDFARPDWLGAEVTSEQRYYNHALALKPYRDWERAKQN